MINLIGKAIYWTLLIIGISTIFGIIYGIILKEIVKEIKTIEWRIKVLIQREIMNQQKRMNQQRQLNELFCCKKPKKY